MRYHIIPAYHIKPAGKKNNWSMNSRKAREREPPHRAEHRRADFGRHQSLCPETDAAGGLPPRGLVWIGSGSPVCGQVWPDTAGEGPALAGHLKTKLAAQLPRE